VRLFINLDSSRLQVWVRLFLDLDFTRLQVWVGNHPGIYLAKGLGETIPKHLNFTKLKVRLILFLNTWTPLGCRSW
jgi:hypothetical protein